MNMIEKINEVLDYSVLDLKGGADITILSLIKIALILVLTFILLYAIKKSLYKTTRLEIGKKYSINNLIHYIVWIITFSWILQILGFDLKIILAGSAALLVGIGLGLQTLFSDFVSGVILLIDSSVKVGDIIDINGLICEVKHINLRTTLVLTRDDKYIFLPNTYLTKNELINWTHSETSSRFEITVGVDYSSDIDKVTEIMESVLEQQKGVLKYPAPFVRFNDFGESALIFTSYFWSNDVFWVENIKSEIRYRLFREFRKQGVSIPFPQRVLHFPKNATQTTITTKE